MGQKENGFKNLRTKWYDVYHRRSIERMLHVNDIIKANLSETYDQYRDRVGSSCPPQQLALHQ